VSGAGGQQGRLQLVSLQCWAVLRILLHTCSGVSGSSGSTGGSWTVQLLYAPHHSMPRIIKVCDAALACMCLVV
jgi:hypothetical protein